MPIYDQDAHEAKHNQPLAVITQLTVICTPQEISELLISDDGSLMAATLVNAPWKMYGLDFRAKQIRHPFIYAYDQANDAGAVDIYLGEYENWLRIDDPIDEPTPYELEQQVIRWVNENRSVVNHLLAQQSYNFAPMGNDVEISVITAE